MKKYLNGGLVDMSPQEVAEFKALQAATSSPVPEKISRRQGWKALVMDGTFDQVQPLIDGIQDPIQRKLADIDWNAASDFERNNPMINLIGLGLGKSSEELDELFRVAATL